MEFKTKDQIQVMLPKPFGEGFDYAVGEDSVQSGDYVRVPFGRQSVWGVVWGKGTQSQFAAKLKEVGGKADDLPPLTQNFRDYLAWVAAYTLSPLGMILKMVLPADDAFDPPQGAAHYVVEHQHLPTMTAKRKAILDAMDDGKPRTVNEIAFAAQVSDSVVRGLVQAGTLKEVSAPAAAVKTLPAIPVGPELSEAQTQAAQLVTRKLNKGFSVTLLDGVTGSGKTEVYFDVIATLLKDTNKQTLVLLPEIALSVQWVERFKIRFGFAPTVWHSGITPKQKRDAWRAIALGQARLVVGARSALFLPYPNLGLVVVDEEHDGSYKQEEGVMYHARDMAVARAHKENFPVLLASATPALETVRNVEAGKYASVQLPHRHGGAVLPTVRLVDMREEKLDRGNFLSPSLRAAMIETLAAGKQTLLFLNRRGYAPLLICRACGHRFACKHCAAWLVVHQNSGRLQCHHCGHHEPMPKACPSCNAPDKLTACGPGVERVHEEVIAAFPQARVAVMASDTTESLAEAEKTVEAMTAGAIDILIGTQMVAKGYHFPALHLIGIVDGDLGLAGGDLRAVERTYQLLHQVAGRAGREATQGLVLLQTVLPDHPVMQALAAYDRSGLEQLELEARKEAGFPPFGKLAALIVDGTEESEVIATCRALAKAFPPSDEVRVLGPAPAPIARLRGRFRYRFLVRSTSGKMLQPVIAQALGRVPVKGANRIRVDIDPYSFF